MKPADVIVDTYIDHGKKDPEFKVGGHVRISKYKSNCKIIHSKLA